MSRTAGHGWAQACGDADPAPDASSVVTEAMRRGEDTTVGRMIGGSKEAVTQAVDKLIPPPEEETPTTGAEGESTSQRIAEALGVPEEAWPSFSPAPFSPAPEVTVDLAAAKVTGPSGLEAELTLPGAAGAQLSAAATLAKAATLEDNYWVRRIDGAAQVRGTEFSSEPLAATPGQATHTPAEQPAAVGS